MSMPFQAPPLELKTLSPFLQRAHETRTADPALSYWCNYHAAQLGIPLLSSLQPASKTFLFQLMDTLEAQKSSLADNDVVSGDEIVAKAYVESVARKVFAGADNEDRTGTANKSTARRFLVAANFIEVLTNFGKLESDMKEKLKYSKWKAANIAKALREGRKPAPGALGEEEEQQVEDTLGAEDAMAGTEAAASRLADLSALHPEKEQEYIDREMAKLTAGEIAASGVGEESSLSDVQTVTAISPPAEEEAASDPFTSMRRAQSRLSYDDRMPIEQGGFEAVTQSDALQPRGSPNFSRPLSTASASPGVTDPRSNLTVTNGACGASSPTPRPLPVPPGSTIRRDGLPLPPGGQGSTNPLSLPPHILSPSSQPSDAPDGSHLPSQPSRLVPSYPSAPPAPTAPIPASAPSSLPASLDAKVTARVQKLAKWAVSALDYDDVETARKHLRDALDLCEGKSVPEGKR